MTRSTVALSAIFVASQLLASWTYVPAGQGELSDGAYITDGNWAFKVATYTPATGRFTTTVGSAGRLAGEGALDINQVEQDLAAAEGVASMQWVFNNDQFKNLTTLTDLALSEKKTTISRYFCSGCSNLTNVNCRGQQTLNNYAFQSCSKLANFSPAFWVQDEPYPFKEDCFSGCISLPFDTLVLHPNSALGWRCFRNCTQIKTVDFSRRTSSVALDFVYSTGIRKVILPPAQTALSCENYFPNVEEIYVTSNLITTVGWSVSNSTKYRTRLFVDPILHSGWLEPTIAGHTVDAPTDTEYALYAEKYGVSEENARRDLIGLWNFKRNAQGLIWVVRYTSPLRSKAGTVITIL